MVPLQLNKDFSQSPSPFFTLCVCVCKEELCQLSFLIFRFLYQILYNHPPTQILSARWRAASRCLRTAHIAFYSAFLSSAQRGQFDERTGIRNLFSRSLFALCYKINCFPWFHSWGSYLKVYILNSSDIIKTQVLQELRGCSLRISVSKHYKLLCVLN